MKIELNGEYAMSDGRDVRILAVDLNSDFPVAIAVTEKCGRQWITGVTSDGRWNPACSIPSVVPKPKRIKTTLYINLYRHRRDDFHFAYASREDADRSADRDRTECVRVDIDIPIGEGLPAAEGVQ